MKNLFLSSLFISLSTILFSQNITNISTNFKNALLNHTPKIDINNDNEISINEAKRVTILKLSNSNITSLYGIQYFTNLRELQVSNNELRNLNISSNKKLEWLSCSSNKLSRLDVSRNTNLQILWANYNTLSSLNVSKNPNLGDLRCTNNKLTSLDVSENHRLYWLYIKNNRLRKLDLSANTELRNADCSQNSISDLKINRYLFYLNCYENRLSNLNIPQNSNLINLLCFKNSLRSLDLRNALKLEILHLHNNRVNNLDISKNLRLKRLNCGNNELNNLELSNKPKLEYLTCNDNQFEKLDVSRNFLLKKLNFDNNKLTSLNLLNNNKLDHISGDNNELNNIDVRNCNLTGISLSDNPNLKFAELTGQKFRQTFDNPIDINVRLNNCPKLSFVCIDNEYVENLKGYLNLYNPNSNTIVSDECKSLVYGNISYDTRRNGCGNNDDVAFSDLKIKISSPSGSTELFTNDIGSYLSTIDNAPYSVFPLLENPDYFETLTPSGPITGSKFGYTNQFNYCITPKKSSSLYYKDLEISIIPKGVAKPGSETDYLIVYKNKGTKSFGGRINFEYMNSVLDFVSATPRTIANLTRSYNQLHWYFSNLKPQETRQISVKLKVNQPISSPSLNNGDILDFKVEAKISLDPNPENNSAILKQIVSSSLNTNSLTCLEGNTLKIENIGTYLHYLISFNNNEKSDVKSIRIENIIDPTKLDINSFIPLHSSHPYTAKSINNSKIEFTFNNINLARNNSNNNGYILFKIKTKEHLKPGEIIKNKSSIYLNSQFSKNTNTDIVTVEKATIEELNFINYFSLSPNPTKTGIVTLTVKNKDIDIDRFLIFDMDGREIVSRSSSSRVFVINRQPSGTYIFKAITDKGTFSTKIIKTD